MRKLIVLSCILFSITAFGRKPSSIEYNCRFEWKTISDPVVVKEQVVRDLVDVKLTKEMTVSLDLQEEYPKIKVKENYSDGNPQNYLEYNFTCNRNLTCKGGRVSMYEGKEENTKFTIVPSNHQGIGAIKGRTLFIYENQPKSDFNFFYSTYKDEEGKPLGLKVSCKE
ncbi:MAG: hypothetical protein K2Q18_17550 [Bdellovibrionales bacterium]|nr:hypothetical protein [Bdellovibrionales bacterium]